MLLRILALLILALPLDSAWAHPGVGIVRDRQGNVFYTDLQQVWRISPAGQKTVVVRNVHSHELAIDSAGNVYGEDSRYLGGEGDDRYRHRIWRRSPDGRLKDIEPWSPGFWRSYGFVRDLAGTMYWIRCPARRCTIVARTDTGRTRTVVSADGRFTHPLNWLTASATDAGVIYVIDGPALRRVDALGRVTTVANNVGDQLMGLWPVDGYVYVAAYGNAAVVRVKLSDGSLTTVARSPAPWAPSGVVLAPDGHFWVLEYSTSNEARVRRIAPDGTWRVF